VRHNHKNSNNSHRLVSAAARCGHQIVPWSVPRVSKRQVNRARREPW
jgi:hypothetical protein